LQNVVDSSPAAGRGDPRNLANEFGPHGTGHIWTPQGGTPGDPSQGNVLDDLLNLVTIGNISVDDTVSETAQAAADKAKAAVGNYYGDPQAAADAVTKAEPTVLREAEAKAAINLAETSPAMAILTAYVIGSNAGSIGNLLFNRTP